MNYDMTRLIVSVLRTTLKSFGFVNSHAVYFVQCVTPKVFETSDNTWKAGTHVIFGLLGHGIADLGVVQPGFQEGNTLKISQVPSDHT